MDRIKCKNRFSKHWPLENRQYIVLIKTNNICFPNCKLYAHQGWINIWTEWMLWTGFCPIMDSLNIRKLQHTETLEHWNNGSSKNQIKWKKWKFKKCHVCSDNRQAVQICRKCCVICHLLEILAVQGIHLSYIFVIVIVICHLLDIKWQFNKYI